MTPPAPVNLVALGSASCTCFRIAMPWRRQVGLHRHDAHEFYFCDRGGGSQHTSAGVLPMHSGHLYFFPEGTAHMGNGAPHGRSIGIVLTIGKAHLTGYGAASEANRILDALADHHATRDPTVPLSATSRRRLRALLHRLVDEFRDRPPGYRTAIHSLTCELLVLILRDPATDAAIRLASEPTAGADRLAPALRICQSRFDHPWTVAELAEMVGLGRSRFHQLFSQTTGCSPTEFLNRQRIAAACRHLDETDNSPMTIALDVGYGSVSHFYQQFRRRLGCSPDAYRRRGSVL